MYIIELILYPFIYIMEAIFSFYVYLLSSAGLSILLLSFTMVLLFLPLRMRAERFEKRISTKMQAANQEVQGLKGKLKGEELFLATEKIYAKHNYHPIQSVGLAASFLIMLPVLISAIIIFSGNGILSDKSFLFIDDLSKPDHLIGGINVLPFAMSGITVLDASLRFRDDKSSRIRFYVLAAVLLALVYNLSSGLVLYWTGSNLASYLTWLVRSNTS